MDRAPSRVWDLLEHYSESAPNDSLYTFLDASGVGKTVTVSQFRQDAIATANYLKAHGAQPDELLLVSINQGYESATIFWGAMLLGAIPSVLAYSPPSSASHGYVRSIENLIEFTGAPALVVEPDYLDGFTQDDGFSLIAKPTTDELGKHVDASPFLGQSKGRTAYVQFSSGTTGTPKGVVLTHEAIIDYLAAMHTAWEIQESDVFVGWLPLFHDMGLTIQLLQPVFSHTHSVLFSPTDWLLKPHILFEAVHRFNGTITWMPNFAFNFCLRHVRDEQLAGMDLSSWRILGCASEPVQIESLNAFAARFDEFGLDPNSLMVAYGLAENIAAVSITPLETSPNVDWVSDAGLQSLKAKAIPPESDGARALASCGYPIPSTQISVVDDRGQDLEDRQVGNVLVKSPYMFDSYYQLPQETNESMQVGWLWTGDLGYMLNGELYICGRKKELIIVRGRNLLPHHIEEIAAAVLGKNLRYSVAFGIEDTSSGTEAPVLVCEMRQAVTPEQSAEMEKSIREEVNQILQIHLEDVRFEEKGWIAKTTSGKINHFANREKYLKEIGEREAITLSTQNKLSREFSAIEETLFHIWSQLLKTTAIGMQDDFFKLGGDSLAAAELILEVEAQFGIHLPSNLLFERISFSEMAQYIDQGAQMAPEKIAVAIQPIEEHSDRIPFFCVHAINGNVLGYWRLSKLLGQHQPFYGLQAHGLNGLGRPDRRVEIMARRYIDAIREIQPQGPYSLGGYCFGGLVAYEMALQLREAGEKIKDVIIIDFHAPRNDSNLSSILEEFERLSNLLAHLPSEWRKYKMLDRDQKQARRQRIVGRLKKRFQQLKGEQIHLSVEDTFDPDEFSPTRLRIDGAIVEAYYHYQPKPYPGPVTLLRTKRAPIELDKSLGWRRLSQNGIEIIDLPGSHETVLNQPYVETLAEKLKILL